MVDESGKMSDPEDTSADDGDHTVIVHEPKDATKTRPGGAPPLGALNAPQKPPAPSAPPAPPQVADDDRTVTRTIGKAPQPPAITLPGTEPPTSTAPRSGPPPALPATPAPPVPPATAAARPAATAPVERSDSDEAPTMVRTLGTAADDVTVVRPRPRSRPRLIMQNTAGGTREVPLTEADVTIGRATTCDVVLTNAEVSRLHVRIVTRGEDHVLVPVGARRNTYVNDELTLEERLLRHGDVIRLASEELTYADAEQARAAAPQAPTERTGRSRGFALASAAIVAVAAVIGVLVVRMSRTPEVPKPVPIPAPPPAHVPAPVVAPPAPAVAPPGPEAKVNDLRPPEPPPPARPDTSDRIAKLLYQGDIAFVENKYTTPPDESALYFYREALELDPQNARGRSQVALIIDRYLEWAEKALAVNDRARARLFADKAAYAHEQVGDVGNTADIERRLDLLSRRVGSFTKK